ncbi:MAG: efflux RND transporter permease subunit [Bacteroidota bacterium]|nr:efflux RND transporter permease subunit [Bacteroidota bacterium]
MNIKKFAISNYAVNNKVTIYFFTVVLILFGIMSYQSTPKENFPEVEFPYFSVSTIYPGTSPEDIENLVTRPIEKQLKSIDGIKNLTSNSIQDFSMILIEFNTDVKNNIAHQDVQEAIDKAKADLPSGILQDPELMEINVSEFPILFINLTGDLGLAEIKSYAENLQDRIEGNQAITRVDIVGALEREFQINLDLYKMQAAGISFSEIENSVVMENMTISGGQIKMDNMERNMRIIGEFKNVDDIKNLLIRDGIYLKDIADVRDDFADRESYSRLNGDDVITLNVIKKSGKNLITTVKEINLMIDDFKTTTPANLEIITTGDQSQQTKNSVKNLFNTIILGFIVVVVVLMFFMGVDNALFVATAIPLSMVISFIVIPMMDFTMNMVVLMAFILVLGIVVDNAIVVVENIYRHFMKTKGLLIKEAAKIGTAEVAAPVFAGTLTTMAPFFPLIFWPGVMGKFMMYIPITLIVALTASMLVAFTMNPVFAVSFMKYRGNKKHIINHKRNLIIAVATIILTYISYLLDIAVIGNLLSFGVIIYLLVKYIFIDLINKFQKSFLPAMSKGYEKIIKVILKGKNPYFVLSGTVLLLFFTIFLMQLIPPKVVVFPASDPNSIHTYIKMPAGTELATTDSVARIVEKRINGVFGKNNPDIESIVTNIAMNAGEDTFDRSTQDRLAKVSVNFIEYQYRTHPHTSTYINKIRDAIDDIPGAEISVVEQQNGPPTGKPINIEISGEEISELLVLVDRVKEHIESMQIPGIEELKSDTEVHTPELIVEINRDKAKKLGISTAYLGSTIRTALYGKDISKIRDGEDEYDIRLRLKKEYRADIESIMNIKLMLPGNHNGDLRKIPLSAVANVKYSTTYGGIKRKDHKRVITVSSNVLSGYNANEIVQQLNHSMGELRNSLDKGYKIKFTGEQEKQKENFDFLSLAFLLAIVLIIIILVIQFNSVAKPLVIVSQIIFSLIGVLLGITIFKIDFSVIMTGMGIIAVGGIVVKNAIIMIDYIDNLINEGYEKKQAIIKAGATRLTPVILTAASTILGLIPLAISMNIDFAGLFFDFNPNIYFGGDATFWKPLAWTIIFGLGFATFLTLILVPAMYSIFIKPEKTVAKK